MENEVAESSSNVGARSDVLCTTKRFSNIEVRNNNGWSIRATKYLIHDNLENKRVTKRLQLQLFTPERT